MAKEGGFLLSAFYMEADDDSSVMTLLAGVLGSRIFCVWNDFVGRMYDVLGCNENNRQSYNMHIPYMPSTCTNLANAW